MVLVLNFTWENKKPASSNMTKFNFSQEIEIMETYNHDAKKVI